MTAAGQRRDGAHVLLARLDSEGDVLLAGPAVRAVAARAGRVTLLCGPRGRNAARLLPCVDDVIVHEAAWIDPEPGPLCRAATLGVVQALESLGLDEAIILTSFHQSPLPLALLLRLAHVPIVAATSVDYSGSLLDVRHRIDDDVHEVERSLSLVASLGYMLPRGDDGTLQVSRPRRAMADAIRPFHGRDYVVVHPGASVPARAWSADRNAELVQALADEGRRVAVTGSAAEADLTASVAGPARPEVADLGGKTELAELVEVLAGAGAVVAGNTGPAHLAAAVGTPAVSIFAPTVPAVRWRPWRVPHVLLGDQEIGCSGCRARSCPVEGHPCIGAVEVDEVLDAVHELSGLRGAGDEATVEPVGAA